MYVFVYVEMCVQSDYLKSFSDLQLRNFLS